MMLVNFHGLVIRITAPISVLDALHDRFAHFPRSDGAQVDIAFDYNVVPQLDIAKRQAARWRPFYKPRNGDALYNPEADECYLETGEGISALCKPAQASCRISAVEPLEEKLWLLSHPFVTLPLMEILKRANLFVMHAAGVARNGRSILICGTSGAGKTTLTVALVRAGFDFMGDDLTVVKKDHRGLMTLAFPEVIDITEKSASFFPELLPLTTTPKPLGWLKQRLHVGDYYQSSIAWETTPAAILFPRIANTAASKVIPLSPTEALLELSASVLLTDKRSTGAHLNMLAELTRIAPCYQLLTGNDFEEMPRLVRSLL